MPRQIKNNNCHIIIQVFIILPVFAFFILSCQEKNERLNPFESTLDELFKTDPSIVCFSEKGAIPVPLSSPFGIAVDTGGRIYVTGERKLIVMDETGDVIDQVELDGKAPALAVTGQEHIYLGYADYVEKISLVTKERHKWAPLGNQALITSVSANNDVVVVADAGNRAVLCYDTEGNLQKLITGEEKEEQPYFIIPSPYFDIAMGSDDTFWVTNPGRYRVEHWSVAGDFLDQWGEPGGDPDKFCGCCNPVQIALLPPDTGDDRPETKIVTAEKGIPRVKLYRNSGDFQCVVAPPDLFKIGTKGLDLAAGMDGRIYVLDPARTLVRVFENRGEKHEDG